MRKDRTGTDVIGRDYSPETVQRMCFGKRIFLSKNAARDAGVKFGNSPYKCPVCHDWHLTHLDNEAGNQARRRAKL